MPHPIVFDEADLLLARLRTLALNLPRRGREGLPWASRLLHHQSLRLLQRKVKVDGNYQQHEQSVIVLLDPEERATLLTEDRCFVPAYLNAYVGPGRT